MKITNLVIDSRYEDIKTIFTAMKNIANSDQEGSIPELHIFEDLINLQGKKVTKNEDELNKFKGDIFEIFCEIYSNLIKSPNECGFVNYIANDIDDYGVDGYAVNYANIKCAIQVKFRSNPTTEIDYASLAKTDCQARRQGGVETEKQNTIILFTNCKGANDNAKHVLKHSLYTVNREKIESQINGNIIFWNDAYNIIEENV